MWMGFSTEQCPASHWTVLFSLPQHFLVQVSAHFISPLNLHGNSSSTRRKPHWTGNDCFTCSSFDLCFQTHSTHLHNYMNSRHINIQALSKLLDVHPTIFVINLSFINTTFSCCWWITILHFAGFGCSTVLDTVNLWSEFLIFSIFYLKLLYFCCCFIWSSLFLSKLVLIDF